MPKLHACLLATSCQQQQHGNTVATTLVSATPAAAWQEHWAADAMVRIILIITGCWPKYQRCSGTLGTHHGEHEHHDDC
jgi:hypothetical protein